MFLVIFNAFTHVAGTYGFGQSMLEINNQAHVVEATKYECIGQAFAIVGMSIAKASLGAFLLRLVVVPWHRIAIWTMMMIVVCASVGEFLRKLDDEIPWGFMLIICRSSVSVLLAVM